MEVISYFILRKDEKRQYEFFDDKGRVRKVRRDRDNAPGAGDKPTGGRGGRGGRRPPRTEGATTEAPKVETPAQQAWFKIIVINLTIFLYH